MSRVRECIKIYVVNQYDDNPENNRSPSLTEKIMILSFIQDIAQKIYQKTPIAVKEFVRVLIPEEDQLKLFYWLQPGTFSKEKVNFGSFRRLAPISPLYGLDRGLPIDRYYIERFLSDNISDIHGHLLEIGDNYYTRKFGGQRVIKCDVLHVTEGNPIATIIADLAKADNIPSNTFDCIICTQTLQFIFDYQAALRHLYRILKPGGVILLTTHGTSRIDPCWDEYWRFTAKSTSRIFQDIFLPTNVRIKAYGNVLASISFLQGLAAEELSNEELDYFDPNYETLITVRATKPLENGAKGT